MRASELDCSAAEARVVGEGGEIESGEGPSGWNLTVKGIAGDVEEPEVGLVERRDRSGETVVLEKHHV